MPLPQPEEVFEIARELLATRQRLSQLEDRYAALFANPERASQPAPAMNLKARIIQFLAERPDLSYNMTTIATALGANENSVGPYLSELAREGKIEKRDRGLYGALREPESEEIADDDIPF